MKWRIFAISLLFSIVTPTMAQMHRYSTNFTFSKHNFIDTIPLIVIDDQLYIDAELNGQRFRFNLDTGASQGVVYKGAYIGYWTELGNVVSHDANGRSDTVKVIKLPPFSIGNLVVSDYVATVLPHPAMRVKYDGIIGFDIFNKGLCAKIDVANKRLIITDRRHFFENEDGYEVRYKLKWFVPYLLVSPFMRHVDEVLFDTGSRPLYTINKEHFDTHAYKSKHVNAQIEDVAEGHLAIGTWGTEQKDQVVLLRLKRLKWDEFSFKNVRTLTTQGASRIGTGMLQYGSVIINPFRKRITFQPYTEADSVVVDNEPPATAFVPINGKATVGLIFEHSKAYEAGLRQGDVIQRINGQSIPSFDAFTRYPFVEGRTYRFEVVNTDGERKTLAVPR